MLGTKRDVFFCHASEDKEEVVRPLVEACTEEGISCWYDEAEIQWGDSITEKVNEGLANSRYVVVVLSQASAVKTWPQRELNAVLNQEASRGEVKILPLLVGSPDDQQEILAKFPLLNDKRYLPWGVDLREIVRALRARLGRSEGMHGESLREVRTPGLRLPLPKIQQAFTQRDKDMFLRNAFVVVKGSFQEALQELGRSYQEVETDFAEVTNFKFVSTIYVRGNVAKRCKIWLGGLSSSDSIAYLEGQQVNDSDSSLNDMLRVEDDGQSLGFKPSGKWFGGPQLEEDGLLSAEQAGEYLWRRFTEHLG
jgi:hypothetical protein